MKHSPFPWVVLVAYGVLLLAPRINRWIDHRPRLRQPRERVRGHITRRSTDLERRS